MIQLAAKYKYFQIVELLIKAGIPCPPDIKRKIDRNNNKSVSTRPTRDRHPPTNLVDENQNEEESEQVNNTTENNKPKGMPQLDP